MSSAQNKRKAPPDDGSAPAAEGEKIEEGKRLKADNGSAAPAPFTKKPDLAVLENAKQALAKQKELKEKLERLKQATSKLPSLAPTAPKLPSTKLPPPLVLRNDADLLKAAAPLQAKHPRTKENPLLNAAAAAAPQEGEDASHFDPYLADKTAKFAKRRPKSTFKFVEDNRFTKEAEEMRLRAQYGDAYMKQLEERRKREEEEAALAGMNPDQITTSLAAARIPLPEELEEEEERRVPSVEWWDAKILADKSGGYGHGDKVRVREDRITLLVEHPVLLDPPGEAPPPPPQPLKLTRRELKKMRTQRRLAREQEKQDLIRQGLLEPPKPKVKISNLMRVLGAEAAADPTAIEAEVRRQMAERAAAHEDRNLARMLTPAERREKKLNKLLGEKKVEEVMHVAVYKVGDLLSHPQLKFKVEVNARENHLNGVAVCVPGEFCCVVVEGGEKTLRRYEKLMLRRIDWNDLKHGGSEGGEGGGGTDDDDDDMDGGCGGGAAKNYCCKVWTGVVKEQAFRGKFKTEEVRSEHEARRMLDDRGVGHYWDLAAAFESSMIEGQITYSQRV